MPVKSVSQRTMVEMMRTYSNVSRSERQPDFTELLYEHDFPHWFTTHAESEYGWNWRTILIDLRNGRFFFPSNNYFSDNSITGQYLSSADAEVWGEVFIQQLAALATSLPTGEAVLRSLQLDGFDVNKEKLSLVPLEGPVSAAEEEKRLAKLAKNSGIPDSPTVLKHMADADSLYTDGKDHASLNESRNLIQALIDGISVETDRNGKHSAGLPGATSNRIDYLTKVGFFTTDEQAAFKSAWGSLSAGSHPGVPEREQARIGLILAFEFGQLLMLKFANWKTNAYAGFS